MLSAGIRTFKEIAMDEVLPLAEIHEALLRYARDRSDIVVFGAHAVNAYLNEPRMTQDVDLLARDPASLSEELRAFLSQKFSTAIRIRELKTDWAYRLYQVRKPNNRHLADIRGVEKLPPTTLVEGILVPTPAELIALKTIAYVSRMGTPKSGSDWRDIASLLLEFPNLKVREGDVLERLRVHDASDVVLKEWDNIVEREILPDNDEY